MTIKPNEVEIIGRWILDNGKVVENDAAKRIHALIKNYLVKVGNTGDGWTELYLDKSDARYWELCYPEGHLQGGGPPCLKNITSDDAILKYHLELKDST